MGLSELWFYVPLDTKKVISETFPKPISWLGMEKLYLTQQNHTYTNQKKSTTQKLEPGLVTSYDIRPGNGEGLFCFRHFKFVTYLVRHPLISSPRTHMGPMSGESFEFCCSGTFYKSNGHPDIQQAVSNHWRKSLRSCNDNIYLKSVQLVDNQSSQPILPIFCDYTVRTSPSTKKTSGTAGVRRL